MKRSLCAFVLALAGFAALSHASVLGQTKKKKTEPEPQAAGSLVIYSRVSLANNPDSEVPNTAYKSVKDLKNLFHHKADSKNLSAAEMRFNTKIDFTKQMIVMVSGDVQTSEGFRFATQSLEVKDGVLVVKAQVYPPPLINKTPQRPGELLLVEKAAFTKIEVVAGVGKEEPAKAARIAIRGRGTVEVSFKNGESIKEIQAVVRSPQELAKTLLLDDADKAMRYAFTALKTKEIDFEKNSVLVVSDGTSLRKRHFSAFTPAVMKKAKDDFTGFAVKDGVLEVTWRLVDEGYPVGEVARPRFQVGFFLLEKFDGQVNFTRTANK